MCLQACLLLGRGSWCPERGILKPMMPAKTGAVQKPEAAGLHIKLFTGAAVFNTIIAHIKQTDNRPVYWDVTLHIPTTITHGSSGAIVLAARSPVFRGAQPHHSTGHCGCSAACNSSSARSLKLNLPSNCTLSGTVSSLIPDSCLAVNPANSTIAFR
eukprot:GGOE01005450.1.p1 GENE.GGOE01005450.1~~GGOE01005450.1.p1  ORF type:complete len:157 (+),score=5.59 GGOE01005450.1:103-573(+)